MQCLSSFNVFLFSFSICVFKRYDIYSVQAFFEEYCVKHIFCPRNSIKAAFPLYFPGLVSMAETIIHLKFGPDALIRPFDSKMQALKWFRAWLAKLEPSLQQLIGLRTVYLEKRGWGMKVRLDFVEERALENVITALKGFVGLGGDVVLMSEEEAAMEMVKNETFKQKQTLRVEAVGNFEHVGSVVANFQQYMGAVAPNGNPTKRQKRSTSAVYELLNRCHRVGSAGLREARSEDDGDEEDNAE